MRRLVPLLVVVLATLAFAASASAGGRLYAPSYGSDGPTIPETISVFDIAANGSPTPLAGSPFPAYAGPPFTSGGSIGLAFGPDGTRAAEAFLFSGGAQGLTVGPGGPAAAGSSVGSASATGIAVSPNGRFAYAPTRTFSGVTAEGVRGYAIAANGSLSALAMPASSSEYYGIAMTPNGQLLFAGAGSTIQAFTVGANGTLTPATVTPASVSMLATSPDGRFLFVGSNSGADGVTSYAIGAGGSLTPVGAPALTGDTDLEWVAVAPDGRHLYMADANLDGVVAVAIAANGSLAPTGTMSVEDPESIVVSPDGRFLYWYKTGGDHPLHAAAIGANGVPSPLPFSTPFKSGESLPMVFQPGPPPVASFSAKAAAPGAAARFDASASANAAVYDWDFGDGATLSNGGPTPSHAYAKAGKYAVKLSLTDASGCGASQIYTGQSTTCQGGTATTTTVSVDTLPVISKLKAAPKKFVPKGVAKSAKGKRGTSFKLTLNEAASVSLKIERKLAGRKVGGKCKKQTAANAGKKKCPLFQRLGSRPLKGKAGANKLAFNGKLKGKRLAPGAYRASAVATDSAGGRSAAATAAFKILPY